MKYVLMLIGMFGLFIVGYLTEPTLWEVLNREPVVKEQVAEKAEPAKTDPAPMAKEVVSREASEVEAPEAAEVVENLPEEMVVKQPHMADPTAPQSEIAESSNAAGMEETHPIRQIMQQSLLADEVSHFTVAEIVGFKNSGQVELDGVTYDFGILEYRENTIFGERIQEAQALIREGKVEKWMWPSNGMRIP